MVYRQWVGQIYCPDGIDKLSWYNRKISPAERVKNHVWYDMMLYHELAPQAATKRAFIALLRQGAVLEAITPPNFGFRHPDRVKYIFNMSAAFDIKSHEYDENVYFNSR